MKNSESKKPRGWWVVGGTTLIGVGAGFVFLAIWQSSLLLVASILIGIGIGLLLASILPG